MGKPKGAVSTAQARKAGTLKKGDPYAARGWLSDAPGPVKGWTSQRDMPTPPAKSFRHWWAEHERSNTH